MDKFRIHGPQRLQGTVRASGAKNAALPALAASLLTADEVELSNLPRVRDLQTLRRLLTHLGVEIRGGTPTGAGGEELVLSGRGEASLDDAPYEMVKTMRASVLVLGPMLARRGRARVSLPGGCAIGVRPIDQHLLGLEALGATVRLEHGYVNAEADRLRGARFRFAAPTVTGTENLLMAATLAEGATRLENCAREPEVVDLARLLNAMGARIVGAGSETIEIDGVTALHGARHAVLGDRIEGGTYLIAAAITGGDVTLADVDPADLSALLEKLAECGCTVEIGERTVRVRSDGPLRPRDVVTAPHPGFPTDLQAQYMALMTQAEGVATLHETVFENRFQHVPELMRMGADIRLDGGTARIYGRRPLSGANVMATDLRASACLVLAALVATGTTEIDRIYHLDRGYETMESKLAGVGAHVERLSGAGTPIPVSA